MDGKRANLGHSSFLFVELLHHLLTLVLEENWENRRGSIQRKVGERWEGEGRRKEELTCSSLVARRSKTKIYRSALVSMRYMRRFSTHS